VGYRGRILQIQPDTVDRGAGLRKARARTRHRRLVNVTHHDVRASLGVSPGEGQSNSAGTAGDDRDPCHR
jgi:hypothetical protein